MNAFSCVAALIVALGVAGCSAQPPPSPPIARQSSPTTDRAAGVQAIVPPKGWVVQSEAGPVTGRLVRRGTDVVSELPPVRLSADPSKKNPRS